MAEDGGCERDVVHRMNEGYRAWGELKSVLSNRGLVSVGRVRVKPRLGWMDGVKVALGNRLMMWRLRDNARKIGKSLEPWHICN